MAANVAAVASAAFPPDEADVLAERGGSTGDIQGEESPRGSGDTGTISEIETTPIGGTRSAVPPRLVLDDRQAFALGFVPVPGLLAASRRDVPGFVLAVAGTVALSWGTIYGLGRAARSPEAFWVPAIVAPYAICVGMNQLSIALGKKRVRGVRAASRETSPGVFAAGLAPLFATEGRRRVEPSGASIVLSGSF